MKKIYGRAISSLLCAALIAGSFGVPVHAEEAETAEIVQTTDSLEESETGETAALEETVYETETDTQAERQNQAPETEETDETAQNTEETDETAQNTADEVINFKDENLKKALAEWDADGDGNITKSELTKAEILDLGYCGISDISGLEYAVNASDIILSGNSDLEDISPLYLLTNLRALIVGGCNITDITGIEYLTGLMTVSVGGNTALTDISPLFELPNLDWLDATGCDIESIEGIEKLSNLLQLYLTDNENLTDISPLYQMPQLTEIGLERTGVSGEAIMDFVGYEDKTMVLGESILLGNLRLFPDPEVTVIDGEDIVSFVNGYVTAHKAGTARLKITLNNVSREIAITVYDVPENAITFSDPNLKKALMEYDTNGDLSITRDELAQATELDLSDRNITDITGLEYAVNVTRIDLSKNNNLFNIDPIKNLPKLKSVSLRMTFVNTYDIRELAGYEDAILEPGEVRQLRRVETEPTIELSVIDGKDVINWDEVSGNIEALKTGRAHIQLRYDSGETENITIAVREDTAPENRVYFGDEKLEAALMDWDTNGDGYLTEAEMASVTYLYTSTGTISDLTGLEYAVNLQRFSIGYNDIEDISVLGSLTKLISVGLVGNSKLKNIEPLFRLKNLRYAALYGTSVSDEDKWRLAGYEDKVMAVGSREQLYSVEIDDIYPYIEITDGDDIVSIEYTDGGYAIAQKEGTANIHLTFGSIEKDITITVYPVPKDAITFNDSNLKAALSAYDINNDASITEEELAKAEKLDLSQYDITDLTGLEYAVNVTEIDLSGNARLSNIDVLYELDKLAKVNLEGCDYIHYLLLDVAGYKDRILSPGDEARIFELEVIPGAETAIESGEDIIDYEPSTGMVTAKKAGLASISVKLGYMAETIKILVREENAPEGAIHFNDTLLEMALIQYDDSGDGYISENELAKVEFLEITNSNIKDLTGLRYAKNLRKLSLYAGVSDVTELSHLESLQELDITNNKNLSDITPLYRLTGLELLNLTGCNVSDIEGIENLHNLKKIWLQGNRNLTDISPLFDMTSLTDVYASSCNIADIRGIENLVHLESLSLDNNQGIGNLQEIGSLTDLKELSLASCGIDDISFLENLKHLNRIELNDNPNLKNIDVLFGLPELSMVWLYGVNISDEDILTLAGYGDIEMSVGEEGKPESVWVGPSPEFKLISGEDVVSYNNVTGVLTGLKEGEATARVSYGFEEKYITITVGPGVSEKTVTYNANGGSGAPEAQTKFSGTTLALSAVKPVKSYTITYNANGGSISSKTKSVSAVFKEWNTQADGKGTSYAAGASYTKDEDVTLYAQWTDPKAGTLAAPARSGYTFDGWYTAATGGSKVTSGTTITKNTTLHAHWTKISVTGVKLNKTSAELTKKGATVSLTATVSPNDAADKNVTWTSSNTKVATVNSKGVVTAVANGTATITVKTADGGKTAACKVTVKISEPEETKPTTPEYKDDVEAFVAQLYKVCLDRNPDAGGLNTWTTRLKNKQETGVSAAYGFVFSNEFKSKNLCNEDYVEQLYAAFMGRKADDSGRSTWVGLLESGTTREEVFNGFALSNEFADLCRKYGIEQGSGIEIPKYGTVPTDSCSICGKEDGITGFVTRLYQVCLNRKPDAGGLKDWKKRLSEHTSSGREVAYGFIFSQEFIGKNYSDADYVEHLYEAFMGRSSDAAGKTMWVDYLKKGWSREQVFDGFVGSDEFTKICNSYGIVRD